MMTHSYKTIAWNLFLVAIALFSYDLVADLVMTAGYLTLSEEAYYQNSLLLDSLLVTLLAAVYGAWLYRSRRRQPPDEDLRRPFDSRMLLSIPIVTLGMKGLSGLWFLAVDLGLDSIPLIAESVESFETTWGSLDTQPYVWALVSVVVMGPITEELLFRGLVFRYLERIRGGWFPILVSGIAFGLWHQEPVQCVYTAVMGIALGVVYANTRSLNITIAIHILNNLLATLPPSLDSDAVQAVLGILSLAMIPPTLVILKRMRREQQPSVSVLES